MTIADPLKILIILMGSVGDVVRGLSIVRPLRAEIANCHITWLVEPRCEELVTLCEGIDEVLVFQRDAGLLGLFRIRKELRVRSFDVTFDMQRHFKSGIFSWSSRAPKRIGFPKKNAKEGNWIFNTHFIPESDDGTLKIIQYHSFLELLGMSSNPSPDVSFRLPDESIIKDSPYILLNVGSNWESKDWHYDGYRKLLEKVFKDRNVSVVLCGVANQKKIAEKIAEGFPVINLVGKTTLSELLQLIRDAAVVVGPDSGPGHIAAALGVRQITLFGPTPATRNAPVGSEHLTVQARIGCMPCGRKRCPGLGTLCMRLISPEHVFLKLQDELNRR